MNKSMLTSILGLAAASMSAEGRRIWNESNSRNKFLDPHKKRNRWSTPKTKGAFGKARNKRGNNNED